MYPDDFVDNTFSMRETLLLLPKFQSYLDAAVRLGAGDVRVVGHESDVGLEHLARMEKIEKRLVIEGTRQQCC